MSNLNLRLAVRQRTLRLAAHAIEQRLNADLSDEVSARLRCPCGSEARHVARRTKDVVDVPGNSWSKVNTSGSTTCKGIVQFQEQRFASSQFGYRQCAESTAEWKTIKGARDDRASSQRDFAPNSAHKIEVYRARCPQID